MPTAKKQTAATRPAGKPAPRPAAKAAAAPPPPPAAEQAPDYGDVEALVNGIFEQCDADLNEAYANTPAGGQRWYPPQGEYVVKFVNNEDTGLCGDIVAREPRDEDPDGTPTYPVLTLHTEIVAAANPELGGVPFDISFYLKPYHDKRTDTTKVAFAGDVKKLGGFIFGEDFVDQSTMGDLCKRLLSEAAEQPIKLKVVYKTKKVPGQPAEKSELPTYNFVGLADIAAE